MPKHHQTHPREGKGHQNPGIMLLEASWDLNYIFLFAENDTNSFVMVGHLLALLTVLFLIYIIAMLYIPIIL